ncbi:MAG: hypothetical protein ABIH04_06480, partial [Planctomycetota bacterium]
MKRPGKHVSAGKNSRSGMVLVLALAVLTLVSMLAIGYFRTTETQSSIARDAVHSTNADILAHNGVEIAKAELRATYRLGIASGKGLFVDNVGVDPTIEVPLELTSSSTNLLPEYSATTLDPGEVTLLGLEGLEIPGFDEMSRARFYLRGGGINPVFSFGEPFTDEGYIERKEEEEEEEEEEDPADLIGAGNGVFDFNDRNQNGIHDPNEESELFTDLNGNGVWDNYTSQIKFAVDDYWGTYSINVQDTSGLIYVNGGIVPGDKERTRVNSRAVERILDNLGVILGIFEEEETFETNPVDRARLKRKPHGKGLGRLLIHGDKSLGIDGRPYNGYQSKSEVMAVLEKFSRMDFGRSITTEQLNLLEQLITTEAWVDPHTVTAGRWLYPEEYQDRGEEVRWDYGYFERSEFTDYYAYEWEGDERVRVMGDPYYNFKIFTANIAAELIQGRADCDAEPRWYWDSDEDDYVRTYQTLDDPDNYFTYDEDDNTPFSLDLEWFDRDDDLDDIMGWVAEPRAPININSASQPVLEAVLAGLTATYVTDRENNLYPNGNSIEDVRTDEQRRSGVPAYNYIFNENYKGTLVWDKVRWRGNLPCDGWHNWEGKQPGEWADRPWEGPYAEPITYLVPRVNPTIRNTPSVAILPEEARRLGAAIIAYRNGSDAFEDLNGNGILDFGDDVGHDGFLREGVEWHDTNDNGYYEGGTFDCWEEFWVFLNMMKFRVFSNTYGLSYQPDRKLESRFTNLADLKVDLIFANCCPNTDVLQFNPNASWAALNRSMPPNPRRDLPYDDFMRYLKRGVTKLDLFDVQGNSTHTTEFTMQPTGQFQIESTGRVVSNRGDIMAERKIRCVVKVFERLTFTTQADFEIGPEKDSENPIDWLIDKVQENGNRCIKYRISTQPEVDWRQSGLDGKPWEEGWQVNVAQAYAPENLKQWFKDRNVVPSYDGQLCLETRYITDGEVRQTFGNSFRLRAYLRFSQLNDWDGSAKFPRGGQSRERTYNQDEMNLRVTGSEVNLISIPQLCRSGDSNESDLDPDEYYYNLVGRNVRFRTSPDWCSPDTWDDSVPNDGELQYQQYGYVDLDPNNALDGNSEDNWSFCEKRLFEPECFPVCAHGDWWSLTGHPITRPKEESLWELMAEGRQGYDYNMYYRFKHPSQKNAHLRWPMTIPKYDMEPRLTPDGFYRIGLKPIEFQIRDYANAAPGDSGISDTYDAFHNTYTSDEQISLDDYFREATLQDVLASRDMAATIVAEFWWKPMYTCSRNDNSVWDGNQEDFMKANHNRRFKWMEGNYPMSGDLGVWKRSDQDFFGFGTDLPYWSLFPEGVFAGFSEDELGWLRNSFSEFSLRYQFHPILYDEGIFYMYPGGPEDAKYMFYPGREMYLSFRGAGELWGHNLWGQRKDNFPYRDEPDMNPETGTGFPDGTALNFNEGEWVHIAIVSAPYATRFYINGVIPYDLNAVLPFEWEFSPNDYERMPNYLFRVLNLSGEIVGTIDEFRQYASPIATAVDGENLVTDSYEDGRYFDYGTWIPPVIRLPGETQIIGINWTEFIPRTLDTAIRRASTGERKTDVIVSLINKNGVIASDSKGESIILYNPLNARYLNVDLGQVQDFDGQFRVQVKIQAEAKS